MAGLALLRRASRAIEDTRSNRRFVASALGIKSWMARTPTCAEARPASCPCCGSAARPVGGRLVVVGHGLVERQVRGPVEAAGTPESLLVRVRRYRCRACKAVLEVGPRGLVRGRWYGAGAIAVALAAYARGETSVSVRRLVSPDATLAPRRTSAGRRSSGGSTQRARAACSPSPPSVASPVAAWPSMSFLPSPGAPAVLSAEISPKPPSRAPRSRPDRPSPRRRRTPVRRDVRPAPACRGASSVHRGGSGTAGAAPA